MIRGESDDIVATPGGSNLLVPGVCVVPVVALNGMWLSGNSFGWTLQARDILVIDGREPLSSILSYVSEPALLETGDERASGGIDGAVVDPGSTAARCADGTTVSEDRDDRPSASEVGRDGDVLDCAICLDRIIHPSDHHRTTWLACGHSFHAACATAWIARSPTCALCRTAVA